MADVMGGEWCHVYVGRGEVERAVGGVTGDGDGRGSWIAKGKCQDEEVVTMEGTRNEDDHPLCLPPNTHTHNGTKLCTSANGRMEAAVAAAARAARGRSCGAR